MMRRSLFPFRLAHQHMKQYWWHRLATVVFFGLLTTILIGVPVALNQKEMQSYEWCLGVNLQTNTQPMDSGCAAFLPHTGENWLAGLIAAVLFHYLAQVVYFKVFVFIIFGSLPGPTQGSALPPK